MVIYCVIAISRIPLRLTLSVIASGYTLLGLLALVVEAWDHKLAAISNRQPHVTPEPAQEPPQAIPAAVAIEDDPPSVEAVLGRLCWQSEARLDRDRQFFENSEAGRRAVESNPNRRLYAVLKPTKAENRERIANVFKEMEPRELLALRMRAKKVLKL
jgi:hypothetical protein